MSREAKGAYKIKCYLSQLSFTIHTTTQHTVQTTLTHNIPFYPLSYLLLTFFFQPNPFMASSPTLFTSILILTLFFLQIHARESKYFFSKIPNNNVDNNFDAKETQITNDEKVDPLTNPEKTTTSSQNNQQPNFIPQTQDNGYGLYGHESGQLPPNSNSKFFSQNGRENGRSFTTTTTYNDDDDNNKFKNDVVSNYKSESEEYYNYDDNNNNNFQTFENSGSKPYENSFYYNKDLYDNGRQSFPNARLSRDDYTTTPLYDQGKYDNFYSNNGDRNDNNNNDNGNNVVRQGMSDTRFMENGKYYYDLNREPHHYSRSSRGYFGNNNNNNGNSYQYGNSMGRYQNQNDEAEFQEEPDEFVP